MNKQNVTFDESMILAMYQPPTREEAIRKMKEIMPDIGDDDDMLALVRSTISKLKEMSDIQYKEIDLIPFQALMEEEEDDDE